MKGGVINQTQRRGGEEEEGVRNGSGERERRRVDKIHEASLQ